MKLVKRAVKGGYVQADTIGNGTWEIGRITAFDDKTITFLSAVDGEEVKIARDKAYKSSEAEYRAALMENREPELEEPELEEPELEEPELEEPEDTGMVKKRYKKKYGPEQNCGDAVALELGNMDLEEVYGHVAAALEVDEGELHSKYGHLNPGQQRMVLGNRYRAFVRKSQTAD